MLTQKLKFCSEVYLNNRTTTTTTTKAVLLCRTLHFDACLLSFEKLSTLYMSRMEVDIF